MTQILLSSNHRGDNLDTLYVHHWGPYERGVRVLEAPAVHRMLGRSVVDVVGQ